MEGQQIERQEADDRRARDAADFQLATASPIRHPSPSRCVQSLHRRPHRRTDRAKPHARANTARCLHGLSGIRGPLLEPLSSKMSRSVVCRCLWRCLAHWQPAQQLRCPYATLVAVASCCQLPPIDQPSNQSPYVIFHTISSRPACRCIAACACICSWCLTARDVQS